MRVVGVVHWPLFPLSSPGESLSRMIQQLTHHTPQART
jgi:hypothetical protein